MQQLSNNFCAKARTFLLTREEPIFSLKQLCRRPRRDTAVVVQPHDVRYACAARARIAGQIATGLFRAVVVSRIEYAEPAWSSMCSAAERARLDSLLRRSKRSGLLPDRPAGSRRHV